MYALQTTTAATSLPAGGIRWDWGHVLDAANLHRRTGQSAQGGLGTGSRGLGAVTTGGAQLDVQGGDSQGLALLGDVLQRTGEGRKQCVRNGLPLTTFNEVIKSISFFTILQLKKFSNYKNFRLLIKDT